MKKRNNHSNEVAENNYHPSDYRSTMEAEQGLAESHEQVSDAYTAGTIDQITDDE